MYTAVTEWEIEGSNEIPILIITGYCKYNNVYIYNALLSKMLDFVEKAGMYKACFIEPTEKHLKGKITIRVALFFSNMEYREKFTQEVIQF